MHPPPSPPAYAVLVLQQVELLGGREAGVEAEPVRLLLEPVDATRHLAAVLHQRAQPQLVPQQGDATQLADENGHLCNGFIGDIFFYIVAFFGV